MKTIMYTVYDEQQILKLEEGGSDGSVRPLEDDSDDESEDVTNFLDLAKFPVPEELSEEEGGGDKGVDEGSEEGSKEGSEDSEEDVPLAQRKVARI